MIAARCTGTLSLVAALALAACSPSPSPPPPPSASAQPSGAPVAAEAPSSQAPRPLRGEAPGGSPRRRDLRWQRALGGDPLELRALAESEGATGLLEGVEDGGEIFLAACEALPFAPDAEIALGRLAEIALLEDPAQSEAALVAIHHIAARPPSRGEPLDPDGVASAAATVLVLASRETLPRQQRVRAISAARVFAERGALDPDRIPADLDPAPAPAGSP